MLSKSLSFQDSFSMLSVLNSKLHVFVFVSGPLPKLAFSKNSYRNSIRASNRLDPSSLLRLSADDKIHSLQG